MRLNIYVNVNLEVEVDPVVPDVTNAPGKSDCTTRSRYDVSVAYRGDNRYETYRIVFAIVCIDPVYFANNDKDTARLCSQWGRHTGQKKRRDKCKGMIIGQQEMVHDDDGCVIYKAIKMGARSTTSGLPYQCNEMTLECGCATRRDVI